jgi:predicted RNA-binding protein YlqC (UPF0109 family)
LYANLFRRYAEGIIYKLSQLEVDEIARGNIVNLSVTVHNDDIGLICGTGAKVVKALQTIFREIGTRNGHNVRISIDRHKSYSIETKPTPAPANRPHWVGDWNKTEDAQAILDDTTKALGYRKPKFKAKEHHDTTYLAMDSDVPDYLFDELNVAIHAWGKSLGRHIFLVRPEQMKAT